ncbi:MAG: hypothetical protein ACIAQU_06090 [Phycisphaerales bacterium JB064]
MVLPGIILGLLVLAGGVALAWAVRVRFVRGLGVVLVFAGGVLAVVSLMADHWTQLTPRPVLAVMLERAEPYRGAAPAGHAIEPDQQLMHSDDRWERLRWQKQYANAAHAWYERVVAVRDAPPGERERRLRALVPHAERMQDLTTQRGGTLWADAWPSRLAETQLRERSTTDDAGASLPLAVWATTELQSLRTGTPEQRWGFVPPPMDVLSAIAEAGLAAGDERAVLYAIDRATPIKSAEAQALLEGLAVDPRLVAPSHEPIADRLEQALRWRADFAPASGWAGG